MRAVLLGCVTAWLALAAVALGTTPAEADDGTSGSAPAAPTAEAASGAPGSAPAAAGAVPAPASVPATCTDSLVRVLAAAGFAGTDLREAWAIAMRESRGISVGPGNPAFNGRDYGIFQFNRPTWRHQPWWDVQRVLDPAYSAAIAYQLSLGGRTWVLWGLDGDGNPSPSLYADFGWTPKQIRAWVVRPYQRFYRTYPC